MFQVSQETTACGLLALIGLAVLIIGAAFGLPEVTTAGTGIIGLAAAALGILARSQRQHDIDKQRGQT